MEKIYVVMDGRQCDVWESPDYEELIKIVFKTLEEANVFIRAIMNSEPNEFGQWERECVDEYGLTYYHCMYVMDIEIGKVLYE